MLFLALGLVLFTATPTSQRWLAEKISGILSRELQTTVRIGRAQVGLFNRVVLDDVLLLDQPGDTLLSATRLSVKLSLPELANERVCLSSVQLFGFDIWLKRETPETPYNFQFLVDYFASEDTTSSSLNMALSQVHIRRGRLSHDILSEPIRATFDPAHMRFEDLQIRLSADTITDNVIFSEISKLSFVESRSGLTLENLSAKLHATLFPDSFLKATLTDFSLQLPTSDLHIPNLETTLLLSAKDRPLAEVIRTGSGLLEGSLTPADLSPLLPLLAAFDQPIGFHSEIAYDDEMLHARRTSLQSSLLQAKTDASIGLNAVGNNSLPLTIDHLECDISERLTTQLTTLLADSGIIAPSLAQTLRRLGDIHIQGQGTHNALISKCDADLLTAIGKAQLACTFHTSDDFKATLQTEDLRPIQLFEDPQTLPLDHLTLNVEAHGNLHEKSVTGVLNAHNILFRNEEIEALQTSFHLTPHVCETSLELTDNHYSGRLQTALRSSTPLELKASALNTLSGDIRLSDLHIDDGQNDVQLRQMDITLTNDTALRHRLSVHGDFIDAEIAGNYSYLTLGSSLQDALKKVLPSLFARPAETDTPSSDQVDFQIRLSDPSPVLALADIDLSLPETGNISGYFDGTAEQFSLKADLPHLLYTGEDLRNVSLVAHEKSDSLSLLLSLKRMMENGPLDVSLTANGASDKVASVLSWKDHNTPSQRGELSTQTSFLRDEERQLLADISILPTQITVADSIWNIYPSRIRISDGRAEVHDFLISHSNRHLRIGGRISDNPADTLRADLHHIDLQYIFGIIDFHDVEFEGQASGKLYVHNFSSTPEIGGLLTVDNFGMNGGSLGQLFLDGGFGRKDDRAIDLDGLILSDNKRLTSHVVGLVKPGREVGRGMDLHVYANDLDASFINYFTDSFLSNLQGRATGYAHLYGPFRELDLEGELVMDTLSASIDALNTRYHILGGDSVHLRPGQIQFNDIHIYDELHGTDNRRHEGVVNGSLRFEHFQNLHYDFDIQANDLLGYDFRSFGDFSFYGTAFGEGTVGIHGKPGEVTIDIKGRPTAGTIFTYNASTPETLTDNEFITFQRPTPALPVREGAECSDWASASQESQVTAPSLTGRAGGESEDPSDMYINFDLDVTPVAQMRLLMDPRSEDYITFYGSGGIRATYYNKGRFQMYGTYRVDRGSYKLTIQDFIRKDFQFQQGGTIVFGGSPMKGDLNLRAIYTVPGVSLNDLAVGSNFSASSVRVNCIMNIGGRAEQPQISFDFDIPNVNEDEKQMVRSLISSEEERNMQVIYLLGIGRFYTYGLAENQNQTNTAMQSLLSSTLSGQLNDILSNAIGSKDWNFGTNFSTGQTGWSDMDVEGMLSGRLLNNRLLINGTFGYRDTPVANTNFIGDFDVRWLLTPSGTVSLKAYSETNDRYFTKSALTTQGIGIQLQKDFSTFKDLFRRKH